MLVIVLFPNFPSKVILNTQKRIGCSKVWHYSLQQSNLSVCRKFFQSRAARSLLLVQCDSGDKNVELIACARFLIADELRQHEQQQEREERHVILIIQLPRIAGGCFIGFQVNSSNFRHLIYHRVSETGGSQDDFATTFLGSFKSLVKQVRPVYSMILSSHVLLEDVSSASR